MSGNNPLIISATFLAVVAIFQVLQLIPEPLRFILILAVCLPTLYFLLEQETKDKEVSSAK